MLKTPLTLLFVNFQINGIGYVVRMLAIPELVSSDNHKSITISGVGGQLFGILAGLASSL